MPRRDAAAQALARTTRPTGDAEDGQPARDPLLRSRNGSTSRRGTTLRATKAEATRQTLLLVAIHLFGKYGYDNTWLEQIADAAHVTKGALYHHFENKQELFRAVYDDVGHQLGVALDREMSDRDPSVRGWTRFSAALCIFLRLAADPPVYQIRCVDGPAVLAMPGSLIVEGQGLDNFRRAIREAIASGDIRELPVESSAYMLQATMAEGAGYVARAPDFEAALADASLTLGAVLDGLRTPVSLARARRARTPAPALPRLT